MTRSRNVSPARRRERSRSRGSDQNRGASPTSAERSVILSTALKRDLAGKHAFQSFSDSDFQTAARSLVECGYYTVEAVRDMDGRERDLFLNFAKSETRARGRNCLADLRLTLKIFAWFEPAARIRDAANTGFEEIDIEQRMQSWTVDFSALRGLLVPDQDMTNFFSAEIEKGRVARPPYIPYVVVDSLAAPPWLPADDTHARALDTWQATQRTYNRYTGNQDLSLGQYVLHRLRYILAGDLTDAWCEFGGLSAQLNHLAVVVGLSISDHAGIAVTYDFRMHRAVQKMVKNRSTRTNYFEFLSTLNKDVKADVVRDFEVRAAEIKKEKEKEKAAKEKAGKGKPPADTGAQGKGKPPRGDGRWGRKWTAEDWAERNANKKQTDETKPTPVKTEPAAKKKLNKDSK